MTDETRGALEHTVEHVLGLEAEREVSGTVATQGDAVALARAVLHAWVDTVTATIAIPGSGRVTLVHASGRTSTIASFELAYEISPEVKFEKPTP